MLSNPQVDPDRSIAARSVARRWPLPAGVRALMSSRLGGLSSEPWDSLNLGSHVQDAANVVQGNRQLLQAAIGVPVQWLEQVHGTTIHRIEGAAPQPQPPRADAVVTTQAGIACSVLVADCLPVLYAADNGRAVGAAHAGWRGLAGGIVQDTAAAVARAAGCAPQELRAWLGPCIGPEVFEVGREVVDALGEDARAHARASAVRHDDGRQRWVVDLAGVAAARLRRAGVRRIWGGHWCTVGDRTRWFSYRAQNPCGRQAALIWIEAHAGGSGERQSIRDRR